MKILVTTALDAMNLAIENILKELLARQHQVDIFASNMADGNIRMFKDLNIPIFPSSDLTDKKIKDYDFAFCCEDAVPVLRYSNIYVFSYNFIPDTWNGMGADFMFTIARDRKIRWQEDCALMPIGDAKNDVPIMYDVPKKQFLYIDAGHNPFGRKGKSQVANMLLEICRSFPAYSVVVKPRWLPNEQTKQTHRSGLHIYTVLDEITNGEIPDNLTLLNEHRNLQELIDQSVSVITTSINCWIDVACRGKGCIVVDGFDAEEQFETWVTFCDSYEAAKLAGCCVRHDEVVNYLPGGIQCDPDYVQKRIPYKTGVSSRIVDVMEYVFSHFLSRGVFPAVREYDYETFRDSIKADPELSFKELKYNRFKNTVCSHTYYNHFTYINGPVDDSQYYRLAQEIYHAYPLNENGFKELSKRMISERRRIIINNAEICMRNAIGQSIYLKMLYEDGQVDKILDIPQEQILCIGPYHYYLGMLYRKEQQHIAISHFCTFLSEANSRLFNKYPQESEWGIRDAYNYVFNTYDGKNVPSQVFADLYIALYERRNMQVAAYKSRRRAHNFLPKVAENLADSDPERALKCLRLYAKWEYHYNIKERDAQIKAMRSSKIYRFTQRIKRSGRILSGGVRCLKEHGWRYTWQLGLEKIKNKVALCRIWSIFQSEVMAGYKLYSETLKKHEENTRMILSTPVTDKNHVLGPFYQSYTEQSPLHYSPVFGIPDEIGGEGSREKYSVQNIAPFSFPELYQLYCLLMFGGQSGLRMESLYYQMMSEQVKGLSNFNSLPQIFLKIPYD